MDYAVNRSYSSGQGRFTSVDPAGEGLNQYAYVGNNPIDFVDPSGLNVEMPGTHHTSLDPMGVAYRVDGLDSDARTAWGLLNSGAGTIEWHSNSSISAISTFSDLGHVGNDRYGYRSVRQQVHIWASGGRNDDPFIFGGNMPFTEDQTISVRNAFLTYIMSKKCLDWLKGMFDNYGQKEFKTPEEMISKTTFNLYTGTSNTKEDLGMTTEERDVLWWMEHSVSALFGLRSNFGAFHINGRIWLNANVAFGNEMDLPGIIVHELLHRSGMGNEEQVRGYDKEIQENCGRPGRRMW